MSSHPQSLQNLLPSFRQLFPALCYPNLRWSRPLQEPSRQPLSPSPELIQLELFPWHRARSPWLQASPPPA